jgi:hypothetical protein
VRTSGARTNDATQRNATRYDVMRCNDEARASSGGGGGGGGNGGGRIGEQEKSEEERRGEERGKEDARRRRAALEREREGRYRRRPNGIVVGLGVLPAISALGGIRRSGERLTHEGLRRERAWTSGYFKRRLFWHFAPSFPRAHPPLGVSSAYRQCRDVAA